MEIQDVAGEEWCGQQATGLGRTRVWTGHQGMTSWAILDELLTPPAVYPMPCGSLWACQMLPGAHAADLGVVGLLVTTSLLQGWGCASRRSHLGQGECHSQGTGTPIPAYSPTWGGGPETESKGTLRDSPFAHEKSTVCQEALIIPPILARLGEERSKDGVIIQLITANQRYPLGRAD